MNNLKNILILMLIALITSISLSDAFAQRRSSRRSVRSAGTADVSDDIKKACAAKNRLTTTNDEKAELISLCKVKEYVHKEDPDMGPFKPLLKHLNKLFKVGQYFLYFGAIFWLAWLGAKGVWAGEIDWKGITMMVIGLVIVMFARIVIDYVVETNFAGEYNTDPDSYYVDCRTPENKYQKCPANTLGAEFIQGQNIILIGERAKSKTKNTKFKKNRLF